jgi:hypothetical protein
MACSIDNYTLKCHKDLASLHKLNFQDTDGETVLPFEDFIKFLRQILTDRDKNF